MRTLLACILLLITSSAVASATAPTLVEELRSAGICVYPRISTDGYCQGGLDVHAGDVLDPLANDEIFDTLWGLPQEE